MNEQQWKDITATIDKTFSNNIGNIAIWTKALRHRRADYVERAIYEVATTTGRGTYLQRIVEKCDTYDEALAARLRHVDGPNSETEAQRSARWSAEACTCVEALGVNFTEAVEQAVRDRHDLGPHEPLPASPIMDSTANG